MQKLIIGRNALSPNSWVEVEIKGSVYETLLSEFPEGFPHTGVIYKDDAVTNNNITPKCQAEIDYLNNYQGTLYVVVYPSDPITIIAAVVVAIVSVTAAILLAPKIPNLNDNNQAQSANNELSSRGNKSRIGGRIADIFGQVRSYPDLISVPYKVFIGNIEYEITFMCIGRGQYLIEDVRESNTLVSSIEGTRVEFYGPYTSPNQGDPELIIGGSISDPLFDIKRVDAYNGQVLTAKEAVTAGYNGGLSFSNQNGEYSIILDVIVNAGFGGGNILDALDIPSYVTRNYKAGETVIIVDDVYSGEYTIKEVTRDSMILDNPQSINSNWSSLNGTLPLDLSAAIEKPEASIIGPFVSDKKDANVFITNVVALSGSYKEDNDGQYAIDVTYRIILTPVDLLDNPIGPPETFNDTLRGSSVEKSSIGQTTYCETTFVGRCSIEIQRVSEKDVQFEGNVVDEIKIRDFYAAKRIDDGVEFGNITTAHSQVKATDGALAIKERKLSALVTRKLPVRLPNNTFDNNNLQPTKSFADIFCFTSLNAHIGRRSLNQLNVQNIYDTEQEIINYFSSDNYDGLDFVEFSYTFDNDNMSFEETANIICNAVFCTPFRQWNTIEIIFEKLELENSMVFSHRNKIAHSESRSYKFGVINEHDGIELTYVSPIDDAKMTIKVPNNLITNPRKIETVGVRNSRQAYVMAWRIWNKLKYNYITCEFTATGEGVILKRQDKIIVSDNTRAVTFDGQIENQFNLTLKLSQKVNLLPELTYYIAVQHTNKTVEIVECVSSDIDDYHIQLVNPLTYKLSFDDSNYGKSNYTIAKEDLSDFDRFIVAENRINRDMTSNVTAVNYSDDYYLNDQFSSNAPELNITADGQEEPEGVEAEGEPDNTEPSNQIPSPTPPPTPTPSPSPSPGGGFIINPDGEAQLR